MQMRKCGAHVRILADDMQLVTKGESRLETFESAFTEAHMHLADMGTRLAPKTSTTFVPGAPTRGWLRTHTWRRVNLTIPVVNNCRAVGARLNTSENREVGTTLTERMRQAARKAERLNGIKPPYEEKAEAIRTNKLPHASFVCDCTSSNETRMRVLMARFSNALTYTTTQRSVDLTFAVAWRCWQVA